MNDKIGVMFVCLGNICRSPMAEFLFRDLLAKKGLSDKFFVASSATSNEEEGNPIYPPVKSLLAKYGISTADKVATKLTKEDYDKYDYILGMETYNVINILKIIKEDPKHKVCRLLDFSKNPRDIADPWYTRNFELTYNDIMEGLNAFLDSIFID